MGKKIKATATKIMIIRHAEKPNGVYQGISEKGKPCPDSLIVKGWQRAGALAGLFNPLNKSLRKSKLSVPDVLYASLAGFHNKSKRPGQTIKPLSTLLKLPINKKYGRDDYKVMTESAMKQSGTVLICWQHQHISQIARQISTKNKIPKTWPSDCFDLIWVFTLNASTGKYKFSQVYQTLLAGDKSKPKSKTKVAATQKKSPCGHVIENKFSIV